MSDTVRKILKIIIPIVFIGALFVVLVMHFFVSYILDNVISIIPEHLQIINRAIFIIDIFVFILTVSATFVFFFITIFGLKRLVARDIDKYMLAVEGASNHIVITDANGVIFFANKGAERITGYTFAEMRGNTPRLWGGLMPKDFYKNLWQTIKYDRRTFHAEIKNRRKNQEEYYALMRISPIIDKNGNLTGFVATEEDITVQKRIEKDLEEAKIAAGNVLEDLQIEKETLVHAEAKDEAILASIGEGVIAVDNKRKVLMMNKAAESMLGWKRDEVIGKELTSLPLADEKGNILPLDKRPTFKALSENKSVTNSYFFIRKDKTRFPMAIVVTPIILNGKTIGAIDTFRDITLEKEVDKAKTEFVFLASHQLRTPLTAINWYVEMLQDGDAGPLNDKQKEFLLEIDNGSKRMVALVNDLLNVSRLETGRLKIEPIATDLAAFIKDVLKEVESLIQAKGCQLSLEFPQEKVLVKVDQMLLRQVIINLMTNAITYSSIEKKGQIIVSLKVSLKGYTIKITDNGIGIPKEVQSRIYEKFFRADNARTVVAGGNGLGLYLTKQIMDVSGGSIGFESEINKGTTFYVTIPVSGMKFREGEKGFEE